MKVRRGIGRGGALCLVLTLGCSLLVDASDIDAECGTGQKLCPDRSCVALDDPAFGCASDECGRCEHGPTQVPGCVAGACAVVGCVYGFACTGCSINILANEEHCGACDAPCLPGELCSGGLCTVASP